MTKQRTRYSVTSPKAVLDVLSWHVETQLATPEQQDSELLFPAVTGGYRAPTVLNKPFAEVASDLRLPPFTQRGMRRTYNDLARFAKVDRLVKKSISGHGTGRNGGAPQLGRSRGATRGHRQGGSAVRRWPL